MDLLIALLPININLKKKKYSIQAVFVEGNQNVNLLGDNPVERGTSDTVAASTYVNRSLAFTQIGCITAFVVYAIIPGNTDICVFRPSGDYYNLFHKVPATFTNGVNRICTYIDVKVGDVIGWQDHGVGTIAFDYGSDDNVSCYFDSNNRVEQSAEIQQKKYSIQVEWAAFNAN